MVHSIEDYAAFVDRNVQSYLPRFERYSADPTAFQPGWNWAAFFFTFWWFLYRKMYVWSAVCFVSLLIPYLQLLIWLVWPIVANALYYRHANDKIQDIKEIQGDKYAVYLRDAGGVNRWVPWVAVLVSCGGVLLVMLGVLSLALLFG